MAVLTEPWAARSSHVFYTQHLLQEATIDCFVVFMNVLIMQMLEMGNFAEGTIYGYLMGCYFKI